MGIIPEYVAITPSAVSTLVIKLCLLHDDDNVDDDDDDNDDDDDDDDVSVNDTNLHMALVKFRKLFHKVMIEK